MEHPFFRAMEWDKLARREVAPPFKPKIKSAKEANNFDSEFTSEKPVLTPTDRRLIASIDQHEFDGFTFVNPNFLTA